MVDTENEQKSTEYPYSEVIAKCGKHEVIIHSYSRAEP